MKSFALALFAATASASLAEVISFDFDSYFTEVEERPAKPSLESFTYGYSWYGPEPSVAVVTVPPTDPPTGFALWDFSTIGFVATTSYDLNFNFSTPFDDTKDKTQWTLRFVPEVNLGGKQNISVDLTNYFGFDLSLDLWPGSFKFADTKFIWTPPFFEDLCW